MTERPHCDQHAGWRSDCRGCWEAQKTPAELERETTLRGQLAALQKERARLLDVVAALPPWLAHAFQAELAERAKHEGGDPTILHCHGCTDEGHACPGVLAPPTLRDGRVGKDTMVHIEGKVFRCECGGNVFTRHRDDRFTCNSCGAQYTGTNQGPDGQTAPMAPAEGATP